MMRVDVHQAPESERETAASEEFAARAAQTQ
jgi:hypothetical protein